MRKNDASLAHAEHNEKALKYIDKTPDFLDWVITMCFYSSLHYARYKLFPLPDATSDGKSKFQHKTFDEYSRFYRDKPISKHMMLHNLLEEHHPEISSEYGQLMDLCKTARYHNYKYTREESNLAKKLQVKIKTYCSPAVSVPPAV